MSINLNASGEMFTITGQLDVTYACEYLATCSTHTKDWKCTVSGHPIDCYQCIKRDSLAKFKTNHDTLKILTSGIKAEVPGDQKKIHMQSPKQLKSWF